jgi:NAD(P)H dehydrogenase (quinone)
MKVLVVYAHPNPESFNHAMLESFTEGLKAGGHTFEVIDLYDIEFNALFQIEDFAQFKGGKMPDDVLEQQKKISHADIVTLIFPVWFWSYPAILKGWIDRIFSHGFAFVYREGGKVEGLLADKEFLLISSTMAPEAAYKSTGIGDAMKAIDMANFAMVCGVRQLKHVYLYGVEHDGDARKKYLDQVHKLGKELLSVNG